MILQPAEKRLIVNMRTSTGRVVFTYGMFFSGVVLFLPFWEGSLAVFLAVPPVVRLPRAIRCREDEDREAGKAEVDTKRRDVTRSQIFIIQKLYKTTYLEFVMLVSKVLIDNKTIC